MNQPGETRDRERATTLRTFLDRIDRHGCQLESEVRELERDFGEQVYAELIHLLCHLSFGAREAREHWAAIVEHREAMQGRLGGPVDPRVAMVSYFLQVRRKLQKPKIIEFDVYERTAASAYRDELTGLYNYRFFRETLAREVVRAERSHAPLSLVMADVDDFKRFNDRHGHEEGNRALATLARRLTRSLRTSDVAARFGGEEFALILPATPKTGARFVAERARRVVEAEAVAGGALPLTVSLGVATYPADARDPEGLVRAADRALYEAKSRGKNRVRMYEDSTRSYRRVDSVLPGRFRPLAGGSSEMTTIRLSEGGMSFVALEAPDRDGSVEIGVQLPGGDGELVAGARVIRVIRGPDSRFEVAVRFTHMEPADRYRLTAFLKETAQRDLPREGAKPA